MAFVRQVSREVLYYSVGTFVASGIQYLAVPVYTRVFPPAEYSQLALVQTITAAVAGVLVLGGDTTLARFWFDREDDHVRRALTVTWVGFLTAFAATAVLLLLPLSPALAQWGFGDSALYPLFVVGWLVLVPAQTERLLGQVLRNQFRAPAYVATSVLLGALTFGGGVLLAVALDLGIIGILLGMLAAECLVLIARAIQVRHVLHARPTPSMLPSLLRFGVPLVPVTLAFWVFSASDRVIVGKLAGLQQLGYYAVATTLSTVLAVLLMAVGQAWTPRALQLVELDAEAAGRIIGRALTLFVVVLSTVAVAMASAAPWLVLVIGSADYLPAAQAVPWLAFGSVAFGSSVLTSTGLVVGRRTGRLPVVAVGAAAVDVALSLALVPVVGMTGAAMAGAVGYGLLSLGYLWLGQRVWPITLEHRRLAVAVALLLAATLVCTWLGTSMVAWRLLLPVAFLLGWAALARLGPRDAALLRSLVGGRVPPGPGSGDA